MTERQRERVMMYERPIEPPVFSVPITAPPTTEEILQKIADLEEELRSERSRRRNLRRRILALEMQAHSHIQ